MTQSLKEIRPVHTAEPIFPLSVEQYHEMIRTGVLSEDDPIELLEGVLVFHMPKNPPHEFVLHACREAIENLLPDGWMVRTQSPVTLSDGEPEPDLSIVRGENRDYLHRHPGPEDVGVLIEVSDTTLERDQGIKLRSYARAGIVEYWIVNLPDRRVEVYKKPVAEPEPDYLDHVDFDDSSTALLALGGQRPGEISVRSILP